jgi:cytochrome c
VARTLAAVALVMLVPGTAARPAPAPQPRILVFTKTVGFRHASIPAALQAIRDLGRRNGLVVDATEDAGAFTARNLGRYEAVVFLMTTGDVLDEAQQAAFQRFFRAGGGFAGVHSAADTEYGWAWYGRMLGAYFRSHPEVQPAVITVANRRHPSTVGLPRRWMRTDEWYNFARNPRPSVRVLATLDESSYRPGAGAMGRDHPISWIHEFEGGRAWFTGGGHTAESYSEPLFRRHLIGGIRYAAGVTPPTIVSVAARIRAGRVAVTVRYRRCYPCRGVVAVGSARTPIRLAGGSGRVRRRVPSGASRVTVTLSDPKTGLADSVSRPLRAR